MALERKLWNFDFILYRIVSNYCRLSVLGNVLSGSKTFPRRSIWVEKRERELREVKAERMDGASGGKEAVPSSAR